MGTTRMPSLREIFRAINQDSAFSRQLLFKYLVCDTLLVIFILSMKLLFTE